MDSRLDRVATVARALVHELRAENVTFMAGSIAYHAFVSLLPLLLLVLAILSTVTGGSLEDAFIRFAGAVLTPDAGGVLVEELRTAGESTGVSLLGLVVLLWGTLRIFRGLDKAFSDIYETESHNTFVDQISDGVVVLVTFTVAIVAAWTVDGALAGAEPALLVSIVRPLLLVVGLSITFFPMYYLFPDTDVTVREVIPGVLVAAVGLMTFEWLFRFYTTVKPPNGGVIAGILVLLTWLYFSGLLILVGAAVNAVLSNRSADVDIEPVVRGVDPDHADRVSTEYDHLVASLRELEANLAGDELVVTGGDTEVHLPPPRRIAVDASDSTLDLGDGTVELTVVWASGEANDS